jgi:hypothetical protein
MARPDENRLSEPVRKEIFVALVEAQDGGMPVAQSVKAVAGRFGVSEGAVKRIEREGLEGNWPPLEQPPADGPD